MSENLVQKQKRKTLNPKLQEILMEIGGDFCVKVADELLNIKSDEITDDDLAEQCGIKLNIVRKILYILYENKLSEFRKVRDKKSGWFIYYWHEYFDNLKELIKIKQEGVLEKLAIRLQYEDENEFYKCDSPEKPSPDSQVYKEWENLKREQARLGITVNLDEMKNECFYVTTFDKAMDTDFKCPRCGGTLNSFENEVVKKFLREKIGKLRQNIKSFL